MVVVLFLVGSSRGLESVNRVVPMGRDIRMEHTVRHVISAYPTM